jgi:O-antigen/teichoic acid export membrane protein
MTSFSKLYTYGSKLLVAGLLHTIYINAYNFLIGLRHSGAELGFFYQANLISRFPSINFMAIMSRAVFPIQCEMQSEKKALRDSFLSNLRLSSFVILPLMIGLAVLSNSFILVVLSEKWIQMAEYLTILSIAYALTPIMVINNQILLVSGRSDLFLRLEFVKKGAGIIVICLTIFHGLSIICWGILVYNIIDAALGVHYAKKIVDVGYVEQIKAIYKIVIATIIMAIFVHMSTFLFSYDVVRLSIGILVGVSSYIMLAKLFKIYELKYFFPRKVNFK